MDNKQISSKYTNSQKLNNSFLKHDQVKEENKEIKFFFKSMEMKTQQNLRDTLKAVLVGKSVAPSAYI